MPVDLLAQRIQQHVASRAQLAPDNDQLGVEQVAQSGHGRTDVAAGVGEYPARGRSRRPRPHPAIAAIVMFGRRAFTGKLPMTWPRTLAQEPINVGDANYDPLYQFGYGLRTSR